MITLVLGGARSGKSAFAERLASAAPQPVTYLATAVVGDDEDFAERVRRHQQRRPAGWRTLECGADLAAALESTTHTALVDSLGTWIAALPRFDADTAGLCTALRSRQGESIVVSEEVGLGVHPSTAVGGQFRDRLGQVNQAVSGIADRAYLVVAGRALSL